MNETTAFASSCRRGALSLCAALTLSLSACSTFLVQEMSTTGDGRHYTETRHSLLWGIVEQPIELHENHAEDRYRSNANGLQRVTVRTNWLYSLASVVTLGVWTPVDVSWECRPPAPDIGLDRR